jgi:hypothetical protein
MNVFYNNKSNGNYSQPSFNSINENRLDNYTGMGTNSIERSIGTMAMFLNFRFAFQLVYNNQYDQISDYLLIGSIVIFLISICLSASKNKDIMHVIISILTKIALLLLIPVLTALILLAMGSGKKDGRYRDGTQNNTRTAAVAGAGILMVALIGSLVKTDQDQ